MDFVDNLFGVFEKANFVEISLGGEIPEEQEYSLLPSIGTKKKLTIWDIEKILIGIEHRPKVKGAIIKIRDLQIGFARANLIRARLNDLRAQGKKIIVYLESGGNIEYLIASSADAIYLAPWAMLNLIGLKAEVSFYKDALDKMGVLAHMKGFGEYKSASETFTRNSMSKPHKEMINSIVGDLEEQLEQFISEGRGISRKVVRDLINNGPYMADKAKELSLIEGILNEGELEEEVSKLSSTKLRLIKDANFLRTLNIKDKIRSLIGKFSTSYPVIAVIADSGMITLGSSRGSGPVKTLGSGSLNKLLDKVSLDRNVKGLVLRVLSPGGSAVASDLICRKLEEISQKKSVVISMSDVAASGGYLISLGAHKIVADSMTITGSIGIVSGKFDLNGLYAKLGITKESVIKAKNALMFSPNKGFSKDEEKKLLEIMEFYYEQFVTKVSLARKMDFVKAEQVSRGRVWTGKQAKDHGLIDEMGGITTAIQIAKEEAEISEDKTPIFKFYSEPRGLQISSFVKGSAIVNQLTDIMNNLSSLDREKVLTIMPFDINLK
ncbi:MAG: signal peptide peptidase SppA [Thermodesulfobacteriota bacterium]|nr:MAG: signal peptide peptidase SppA [Thermodesulfobacteriota bacterium]